MGPEGLIVFVHAMRCNSNARRKKSLGSSLLSPADKARNQQEQRYKAQEENHPTSSEPESLAIVQGMQTVKHRVTRSILPRIQVCASTPVSCRALGAFKQKCCLK